jgi:carboxymethylenebutenolidase
MAALRRAPSNFVAGACSIAGSYGAKDPTLRCAGARLEPALTANGAGYDVKECPDAARSVLNDHEADRADALRS